MTLASVRKAVRKVELASAARMANSRWRRSSSARGAGARFRARHRVSIISTARNNVPAVYLLFEIVRDGGLLSYGVVFLTPAVPIHIQVRLLTA